jgi:hypothetical protein
MSGNKLKEEECMEAINKPQEAMIIAQGMTRAFVEALVTQKQSKTYWNECSSTKRSISSSNMDKLKKICNGEG